MIKLQVIGRIGGDCTTNEVNGKHVIILTWHILKRFKNSCW